MRMLDRLLALPLRIETLELVPLQHPLADGKRRTTLVRLGGAGTEGLGEDVTFDDGDRGALLDAGLPSDLLATETFGDVTALLDGRGLTPTEPRWSAVHRYRRWAIEAAALDLAFRQAELGLADALGREIAPLRFVISRRVEQPEQVHELLRRFPGARLKLDATPAWTEDVAAAIAATGAVATIDLKGTAPGSSVYRQPDPALYERVARLFPRAWLEDPGASNGLPNATRIAWDEPIASAADVPDDAGAVNVKPARIGSLAGVFAVIEHCARRGIQLYGGGQSEIGPGRGQAQLIAALFYPDAPNDLAPRVYNEPEATPAAPPSPLAPPAGITGFRWS